MGIKLTKAQTGGEFDKYCRDPVLLCPGKVRPANSALVLPASKSEILCVARELNYQPQNINTMVGMR